MSQVIGPANLETLDRCGPCTLAYSWLHLVILRLRARRASNGGVGEIHRVRHRIWVCWTAGIRIAIIVRRARRRDATV
jgi:hypothetical protein